MINLVFGEDQVSSRNKLSALVKGQSNIVRVDGKKATLAEVDMALESDSLFATDKTIIIEQFTKIKPQKDFFEKVLKHAEDSNTDIFLWEQDDLPLGAKTAFKAFKSYSFAYPKFYYVFLDNYRPGSAQSVKLLREVLKTFEPEQVLYGLIRRVRQLLVLKAPNYTEFSEFSSMQSWQLGKLKKQAESWTEHQLQKNFISLASLDEEIKTGGLTMDLAHHLDILVLRDLN